MTAVNYEAAKAAAAKAPDMYDANGIPQFITNKDGTKVPIKTAEEALYGKIAIDAYNALVGRAAQNTSEKIDAINDFDWVTEDLYGQAGLELEDEYHQDRFFTTADRKFVDTSFGGHYVANPLPGYTLYADVPKPGILSRNEFSPLMGATNQGMGEYYSRAIDDSARYIHMRFGKPEFNSLISFFTTYYSAKEAIIANTGKPPGLFFYLGKIGAVIGTHILLGGMFTFGLIMVTYIGPGIANILKTNPNKFYYSRPCMPLYWTMVSNIVNQIATFQGVFPVYTNDQKIGEEIQYDKDMHDNLRLIMPEIWSADGHIDVYAAINRAERINVRIQQKLKALMQSNEVYDKMEDLQTKINSTDLSDVRKPGNTLTQIMAKYLNTYSTAPSDKEVKTMQSPVYSMQGTTPKADTTTDHVGQFRRDGETGEGYDKGFFDNFSELLRAEFGDGASYATMRVDHTGPTSESFSNSTRPSDMAGKINGFSSSSRAAYYSFAGGNVGIPGADMVMDSIKQMAAGALSMVKLDGLLSLAGSAFVDIPDHWENSMANLPSMNYRTTLIGAYGHPVAQIQSIWTPLAMLLAAVLPHSAGMRAYTQPFMVELYDPGFATSRTGIFESLTINRGVSHLGFNKNKQVLAIDVQFTIKDLSSVMYAPLSSGITFDPFETINATDSTWSDYLNVLSGATLAQQTYIGKKLKIRAKNWWRNVQQVASDDYWAGVLRSTTIGDIISVPFPDGGRGDR